MAFEAWMENVVRTFEAAGVVVLASGSVGSLIWAGMALARRDAPLAYWRARHGIGRTVLLGLELLIVADIVLTVTIDSSLESAVTLGLIVLVRTFLSFSIAVEIDGVAPWRRQRTAGSVPR